MTLTLLYIIQSTDRPGFMLIKQCGSWKSVALKLNELGVTSINEFKILDVNGTLMSEARIKKSIALYP